LVSGYVDHYNNVRLSSAAGYITPKDMLAGRQQEIFQAFALIVAQEKPVGASSTARRRIMF
jgi:hypothetical protein